MGNVTSQPLSDAEAVERARRTDCARREAERHCREARQQVADARAMVAEATKVRERIALMRTRHERQALRLARAARL